MMMMILNISCSNNGKSVNQTHNSISDTLHLNDITDLNYEYYEEHIKSVIKKYLNYNSNEITRRNITSYEPSGELGFLTEYINQCPFDFGFSYMPVINKRLSDLLGKRFEFIDNCALQPPMRELNDVLIIHGCEAHNCHIVNYDIYINYSDDAIKVVLYDESTIYCYSEDGTVGLEFYYWLMNYIDFTDLQKRMGTYKNAPIIITK